MRYLDAPRSPGKDETMGLIRGILALVLLGAVVAPAHAMTEDEERAKAHFLAGQSYYEQASYGDALKEFGEAYRISKKPALLYNLARCHEALDHYADAVAMLERYLQEDPDASDRDAIQSRIEHLKERQRAAEQARAAAAKTPAPTVAPSAPPPPAPVRRQRKWTWIVGGVGVAALAGALGTGIASQLDYNSLGSSCTANQCDPSKAADLDRGKQLALATDILWPVGAAAVATAVVLFVVEGRHAPAKHARLTPASGGSTFAVHF
jgi:tetratricopeptide (TPR) repeat protein